MTPRRRRTTRAIVCGALIGGLVAACGSKFPEQIGPSDAGPDRIVAPVDAAFDVEAAVDAAPPGDAHEEIAPPGDGGCNVRLADPPLMDSPHVPEGTVVTYDSNPPSSGPHYPIWANFQEFTIPVADGYLVHSMEHGGVLLLYKCDPDAGSCADIVAGMRAVRDAYPTDFLCDPSIRVRIVIAPRPDNDVPVAAAAWGHIYRADCMDVASLTQFVTAHYGQGPETSCAAGKTSF